jgi:hypothetical protein
MSKLTFLISIICGYFLVDAGYPIEIVTPGSIILPLLLNLMTPKEKAPSKEADKTERNQVNYSDESFLKKTSLEELEKKFNQKPL